MFFLQDLIVLVNGKKSIFFFFAQKDTLPFTFSNDGRYSAQIKWRSRTLSNSTVRKQFIFKNWRGNNEEEKKLEFLFQLFLWCRCWS